MKRGKIDIQIDDGEGQQAWAVESLGWRMTLGNFVWNTFIPRWLKFGLLGSRFDRWLTGTRWSCGCTCCQLRRGELLGAPHDRH